jgi:hypothetical protein
MKVRLVLLKGMVYFKLHYITQVLYKNQLVSFFIIENNAFFGNGDDAIKIYLPHFADKTKSDANIGA